jgi:hypothetical protein
MGRLQKASSVTSFDAQKTRLYTSRGRSSIFPPYEVKGKVSLAPLPFLFFISFPLEPKASKQRLSEKKPRQKEPHKLLGSQQSSKKLVSTGSTKSSQKNSKTLAEKEAQQNNIQLWKLVCLAIVWLLMK